MSLGFAFCKARLIGKEGSKVLSKLLVCAFLPAYTVANLSKNVSVDRVVEYALTIGAGLMSACLAIGFGIIASRFFSKEKLERATYQYVFAFGNIAYFGYPLIGAVFGAEQLTSFMLFCLPLSIAINTYGYILLTQTEGTEKKHGKGHMLKRIFTVPTLATLLGITLGLIPLKTPQILYDILTPIGNCMSPIAMILGGIVLGGCSFKELFCTTKAYLASVVRLIVCPLLFGSVAFVSYKFAGLNAGIFICILASACLPAGMNAIVFPESVGASGKSGATLCFISYLLGLATVPLWFYLLTILV